MVLDRALLANRRELRRIVMHELFHFAWVRMSNAVRRTYEAAIEDEFRVGARGELGWSSEMRKKKLGKHAGCVWREYLCESFCDTAAWLYAGVKHHEEFTLAERFRKRRAAWFEDVFGDRAIRV